MKRRKRDTAGDISSNRSNIARAMRLRMPKIPTNFAPTDTISTFAPQMTSTTGSTHPAQQSSQILIAAPPTSQTAELQFYFCTYKGPSTGFAENVKANT